MNFKIGVKANTTYAWDIAQKNYSLGEFTPAVVMATKGNTFHEVELNKILLTKKRGTFLQSLADYKRTNIGLRYQFTWNLTKRESRLIPQIGLSALFLITSTKIIPIDNNYYRISDSYFGGSIGVVPQIRYMASEKVFLDLSMLLNFIDLGYRSQRIENPAIPIRQQQNGGFEYDYYFLNQLQFKFGAGVRF